MQGEAVSSPMVGREASADRRCALGSELGGGGGGKLSLCAAPSFAPVRAAPVAAAAHLDSPAKPIPLRATPELILHPRAWSAAKRQPTAKDRIPKHGALPNLPMAVEEPAPTHNSHHSARFAPKLAHTWNAKTSTSRHCVGQHVEFRQA